jgi:hypothetical protein
VARKLQTEGVEDRRLQMESRKTRILIGKVWRAVG